MSKRRRQFVLIIGQRPDPHIDVVSAELKAAGVETLLLDRRSGDAFCIELSDGRTHLTGRVARQSIDLKRVKGVWWRVKPGPVSEFPGGKRTISSAFQWEEWKAFLGGLPYVLAHARWVNPVEAHFSASKKIHQLALAQSLGLEIPRTVITNSASDTLGLFRQHGRVVYKTLSSFLVPPDTVIFTSEVSQKDVMRDWKAIRLAPCVFQAYIEKAYEVRVTIVGEETFCVRIDSQSARETSVDWRRNQSRDMYSKGRLTARTLDRLMRLHRRLGLLYATYDFIIKPDNREVFLECNPGGQWLWLERATGCPISRALARLLAN